MPISRRWWFHSAFLILVYGLLSYYFFIVGEYISYPWYSSADADAAYVPQAVLLINDGDLYYLHHPGATVYAVQGGIHRVLSLFNEKQRSLMHFDTNDPAAFFTLLTTAVKTGRVMALLFVMALATTLYALLLKLTGNWFIASAFTFFIVFSKAVLQHVYVVRAESASLLFLSLAALMAMIGLSRKEYSPPRFVLALSLAGLSLGLAVFSKIQIAPALVLMLFGLLVALWLGRHPLRAANITSRDSALGLGVAVLNVLITPYWMLTRPPFLTTDLVASMDPMNRLVYGSLPESFAPAALVLLLLLTVLSAALVVERSRIDHPKMVRLLALSLVVNLIILGVIASAYVVLLPASVSLDGYINNSNYLVYATLTNVTGGGTGFLLNTTGDIQSKLAQILWLHETYSTFATVSVLYIVGAAGLVCGIRLLAKKPAYLVPLYLFAIGLVMDAFSTMRFNLAYSIYAIYSLAFYGVGLARFVWLESQFWFIRSKSILSAVSLLILLGGILQAGIASYSLVSRPTGAPFFKGSTEESVGVGILNFYAPQLMRFVDYAEMKKVACASPDPQKGHNCDLAGGVRTWLQTIGETRRGISPISRVNGTLKCAFSPPVANLSNGACATNIVVGGWLWRGYDMLSSQNASQAYELRLYWLPPAQIKPTPTGDFSQEEDDRWVQVIMPSGILIDWKGPPAIKMQDLAAVAPPLEVQGYLGDFAFSSISTDDGQVIRVTPAVTGTPLAESVIQFGPWLEGKGGDLKPRVSAKQGTGSDFSIRPGQWVILSLWARMSTSSSARLFVQDKDTSWDENGLDLRDPAWQHYAVIRQIRPGVTSVALGLAWKPTTGQDWLETRDIQVFTLSDCIPDAGSACVKTRPPLQSTVRSPGLTEPTGESLHTAGAAH